MGEIKLRKHQSELSQVIDGIISKTGKFKNIKKIIVSAVPAAGKGSVPVNAGKLILAGLADRMFITVPRLSLQTQCEQVFQDPFFKKLFGVNLSIRASTNEMYPCRGMNGFVTTLQAIGHDKENRILSEIRKCRYIVIVDENHHIAKDEPWYNSIEKIIKHAAFVIIMSGTMSRADGKKIGFVKYKDGYVDLEGDETTHVIKYTRSDALQEQAILPISFHLHNASTQWETNDGKLKEAPSFDDVQRSDRSSALFTALETEFSNHLINETLSHWLNNKKNNTRSKLLFICARIGDARRCVQYLKSLNVPALIATSHGDNKECQENIAKFKGQHPVLVTISIAYEGMDVPEATHICILTRIRSREWLEQAVSRVTRVDKKAGPYRSQMAHIFAPKDQAFLEFVEYIEKEQRTRAKQTNQKEEQLPLFELSDTSEGGSEQGPCIPLKSQILELSTMVLGKQNFAFEPTFQTPKQEELSLRRDIFHYLNTYAKDQGFEYAEVSKEAKEINGKSRTLMTLEELRHFYSRVKSLFPIKKTGSFIPESNCRPCFDYRKKSFDLESEVFF